MAVFFNGQLLTTPTTASVVNDDAMRNQNPAVGNAVLYIGKAAGGEPQTVLSFGSPEEARSVLRSGELMDAVVSAFAPSVQTNAPSTIYAVRLGSATQSSITLQDGAGKNVLKLSSSNFGSLDNQISARLDDGSLSGKRISIQYGRDYYTGDNIGRNALSIAYTGTAETATVSVTADKVLLNVGADDIEFDLNDVSTVASLSSQINLLTDWSANVLDDSDEEPTLLSLDALNAADAKAGEITVTANTQAIYDWVRFSGQDIVEGEKVEHGGSPINIAPTAFSGGSNGQVVVQDWQDALDEVQRADVAMLTALTGDEAIHDMVSAHVSYCSDVLRKERRAVLGSDKGTSTENARTRAKGLNNDRVSLCVQGVYDFNSKGALELRPPYMAAALVAAMFASANPGTPMTNKSISVQGLEFNPRNPTDTDELINAGVLCFENTPQGYKVVQSISTWLIDNKYNRREVSCGIALDYTTRAVREAVDVLRGDKASPLIVSRAVSIAQTTLQECARPEPEGIGAIVGDEDSPPYRNIKAVVEGDVTRVTFECSPAIPNNYNLVTVYARPYRGTASA